ncbi:unnamed protein product [marine sediment metagenome]|uniref:Uncharacterized protein n=1 Tax=marine sediment metagenome TaxID=412755 RepID=X0Z5D1_9ZZZZ
METKKTFKEIYNKEEGILIIAVIFAAILCVITIFKGTQINSMVSSMLWTSIVGLAILRVIKAAVKEIKK